MLAPATLSKTYAEWNRRWGAPFGRPIRKALPRALRDTLFGIRLGGGFPFQPNSDTRTFEYPWVFESLKPRKGLRVLEIGGGLAGFQFVLDRCGCQVVNVDPGEASRGRGWPVSEASIQRLNRGLGTRVQLFPCFLEEAGFEAESFDRVVSISVLEHVPDADLETILGEVRRVLKPGGLFILTVDLFLDIQPFEAAESNEFGRNVSLCWLVEKSGLERVHGDSSQLYGYPEFDPEAIMRARGDFLVGKGYPVMTQTLVLRK